KKDDDDGEHSSTLHTHHDCSPRTHERQKQMRSQLFLLSSFSLLSLALSLMFSLTSSSPSLRLISFSFLFLLISHKITSLSLQPSWASRAWTRAPCSRRPASSTRRPCRRGAASRS